MERVPVGGAREQNSVKVCVAGGGGGAGDGGEVGGEAKGIRASVRSVSMVLRAMEAIKAFKQLPC